MEANRFPEPIRALGRFEHEAVAVDPDTGQIYETEDATNPSGSLLPVDAPSLLLPLRKGSLRGLADNVGALEAMRARDASGVVVTDLSVAIEPGTTYSVEWVAVTTRAPVGMPRPASSDSSTESGPWMTSPFRGPVLAGTSPAAASSRALGGGTVASTLWPSFARTDITENQRSALAHDGQVWFLDPLTQTITLKLRFAYTPDNADDDPDGPDNITVSPYGGFLLAEDGVGVNHLIGATADGQTYFLAENMLPGSRSSRSELLPGQADAVREPVHAGLRVRDHRAVEAPGRWWPTRRGVGHDWPMLAPARPRRTDWLVLALVVVAQTIAPQSGSEVPGPDPAWVGVAALLTALGQAAALLWRRDAPLRSALAVMILYAVSVLAVGAVPPLAPWVAIWTARNRSGLRASIRPSRIAARRHDGRPPPDQRRDPGRVGRRIVLSGMTVVVCLSAVLVRSERGRLDAVRLATASEERLRIARDMHDVVGHGLSAVAVQSSTARLALARATPTAPSALTAVESSSRIAMREMRQLLGVLTANGSDVRRTPPSPSPAWPSSA